MKAHSIGLFLSSFLAIVLIHGVANCQITTRNATVLRVNLFPYLPTVPNGDLSKMADRIKREFEQENSNVELKLHISEDDDFYTMDNYRKWLSNDAKNPPSYDVVEPDTLFLADLVKEGLIASWTSVDQQDWEPPCRSATEVEGNVYGEPHWICGYFVFTRDTSIASARSGPALVAALDAADPKIPKVVGDLAATWDTPSIYLSVWKGNHPTENASAALTQPLDSVTIDAIRIFAGEGKWNGKNSCLDGTFHKAQNLVSEMFAKNQADAAFGYSETLFQIFENIAPADVLKKQIRVSEMIVGKSAQPLWFVDSFVLRAGCDESTRQAAEAFVRYMKRPTTYKWIECSEDLPANSPRRYLIPAMKSAFQIEPIKSDGLFQSLEHAIQEGASFPNSGVPEFVATGKKSEILKRIQQN